MLFVCLLLGLAFSVLSSAIDELRAGAASALHDADYPKAISLYSQVIDESPLASDYYRRSFAYSVVRKYSLSLLDSETAIAMDSNPSERLWAHHVKLLARVGMCNEALVIYRSYFVDKQAEISEMEKCVQMSLTVEALKSQGLVDELDHTLQLLIDISPSCTSWLRLRMNLAYESQNFENAIAFSGQTLMSHSNDMEALLVRGRSFLKIGEDDQGIIHLKEALKYDPDNAIVKKEWKDARKMVKLLHEANAAHSTRNYVLALDKFAAALTFVDPLNSIKIKHVSLGKCRCFFSLGDVDNALESCRAVLAIDPDDVDAIILVGDILIEKELFDEAVVHLDNASRVNGSNNRIAQKLNTARVELKKSKRKNYYKILGVDRHADVKTIKKAFRKLALEFHPDRFSQAAEEVRAEAETTFMGLSEAYEILSDPAKRERFDNGEDMDGGNDGGGGRNPFHGGFPFGRSGGGHSFHFNFN